MNRHYVIAKYNEIPLSLENSTVIQKEVDIPNIGREASSWLLWILNNYEKLPDYVTFLQGNPYPHAIEFSYEGEYTRHGRTMTCKKDGYPQHGGLDINTPAQIMGVELPEDITFCVGAQFTVSKEQIRKYPYGKYAKLFEYSINNKNAPWELERLWELMYKI